jgi:hypothetical protein
MWTPFTVSFGLIIAGVAFAQNNGQVSESSCPQTYFHLSDSPYENYFVSTCNFAATVVSLSPNPDSNLTLISPRLIAAFPAGIDSSYFAYKQGTVVSLPTLLLRMELMGLCP